MVGSMGWRSGQPGSNGHLLRYGQVDVSVFYVQEECVFKSLVISYIYVLATSFEAVSSYNPIYEPTKYIYR